MGCSVNPKIQNPRQTQNSTLTRNLSSKSNNEQDERQFKIFNNKFKLEKIRRSRGYSHDFIEFERPLVSKDSQKKERKYKRTNTTGSVYLSQLASTLNRNANIEEEDNEDKINEFHNWTLTKKPNGESFWINSGTITKSQEEIEKISSKTPEQIKSESFVNKRIWFSLYIKKKCTEKTDDNPIIVVSRGKVLEDSYNQLTAKDFDFKKAIHIYFIDEQALDVGGIYREWFLCIFKDFFEKDKKLFTELNFSGLGRNTIYINEEAQETKENMELFILFGKLIAKALMDNFTMKQNLNKFLLKNILKQKITLDDLQYYDLELHEAFKKILATDIKEPDSNFPYVWNVRDKKTKQLERVDLIPNGSKIMLCNQNKNQYILDVIKYISYTVNKKIIDAICEGFYSLIPYEIISIFSVEEFDFILSGQTKIDLKDWRNNTEYKGYSDTSNVIEMFWSILGELSNEKLLSFFTFCTGCAKPPINGFKNLQSSRKQISKFCVEKLENTQNSLIIAKTCFNRIYLPEYKTKKEMARSINTIVTNNIDLFGIE